eukprot:8985501-Lingulodinium_polyedra.AAC.1
MRTRVVKCTVDPDPERQPVAAPLRRCRRRCRRRRRRHRGSSPRRHRRCSLRRCGYGARWHGQARPCLVVD